MILEKKRPQNSFLQENFGGRAGGLQLLRSVFLLIFLPFFVRSCVCFLWPSLFFFGWVLLLSLGSLGRGGGGFVVVEELGGSVLVLGIVAIDVDIDKKLCGRIKLSGWEWE